MSAKQQCMASVYTPGLSFSRSHRCSRGASVERDGKWYCGTHDPVKVSQRSADSQAKWQAEYDRKRKIRQVELSAPALLEALEAIELALGSGFGAEEILDENSPIRDGIRAAIKQARGEA